MKETRSLLYGACNIKEELDNKLSKLVNYMLGGDKCYGKK